MKRSSHSVFVSYTIKNEQYIKTNGQEIPAIVEIIEMSQCLANGTGMILCFHALIALTMPERPGSCKQFSS
jgi:hypothetical protein